MEQLDNHPDVKKYIQEQGYEATASDFVNKSKLKKFNELMQLQQESSDEIIVDDATESYLSEKYQLKKPDYTDIKSDVVVLVKKTETQSSDNLSATAVIDNVWYLTYWTNPTSFQIDVLNIGDDPLDNILGTVYQKKLNSTTWTNGAQYTFSKYNISTGVVTTWYIVRENVKEAFEYNLTVKEDGSVWNYTNAGEYNQVRFNFAAGPYSTITANGGERHHLVSQYALSTAGRNTNTAAAIRMTHFDHLKTPNYGSSAVTALFRAQEVTLLTQGNYEQLLQMEVNGFQGAIDPDGIYSTLADKYYDYLITALFLMEQYFGIS